MNEYQIAYEKAKRESNLKNETAKGLALLNDHEAVVLRYITRYCPYTDGILGADIEVMGCGTLEEASDWLAEHDDGNDDICYQLYRAKTPEEINYSLPDDEEIPF